MSLLQAEVGRWEGGEAEGGTSWLKSCLNADRALSGFCLCCLCYLRHGMPASAAESEEEGEDEEEEADGAQ